jgi:starch synthase
VRVHAFGHPREEEGTTGHPDLTELTGANAALTTLGVDLSIAAACEGADLVHSHTWYANMAGHLASLLGDIPHVADGPQPRADAAVEGRAARRRLPRLVVGGEDGVRGGRCRDRGERRNARGHPALLPLGGPERVKVVHNGIDSELWQRAATRTSCVATGSTRTGRAVIFVGRITRQKGLPYLLRAAAELPPEVQLVLLAGAPDTPGDQGRGRIPHRDPARDPGRGRVGAEMLPRNEVVAMLSSATVFVCPSVYEPLGIVNLEAMACELPVVATATGGIPEVVVHGETGWLVPIEQVQDGTGTPVDPDRFVADLAAAMTDAVSDPPAPNGWGWPADAGPWSPSRGARSATRPTRCTWTC